MLLAAELSTYTSKAVSLANRTFGSLVSASAPPRPPWDVAVRKNRMLWCSTHSAGHTRERSRLRHYSSSGTLSHNGKRGFLLFGRSAQGLLSRSHARTSQSFGSMQDTIQNPREDITNRGYLIQPGSHTHKIGSVSDGFRGSTSIRCRKPAVWRSAAASLANWQFSAFSGRETNCRRSQC